MIRTAKTTATWYKTSNGYYITADPIGQEAIQAVRIVESDEEIARSAKAPPSIGAVLQALIRCSQQGSRPSAPANRPPDVSTGSSALTHKSPSAYMHCCLPGKRGRLMAAVRIERTHLVALQDLPAASRFPDRHGCMQISLENTQVLRQPPLMRPAPLNGTGRWHPDRREGQTAWVSLHILRTILAVTVYAYGRVARAHSCACLTPNAQSTNNHAV